jgi:exodeoxyribonuclease VII large subunit
MDLPERKIFTVSQLNQEIKDLLEGEYPSVWVQGEISNFRPAPSGHYYFILKDASAQIRCVMFKTQNRFLKFRPADGLDVMVWGRLSVYAPRGEYQLILDTMEPRGIGSLMLAFEQLRAKLATEGLFDEARKRPLPRFPRTLGLVTSRKGAVVQDMIRITRRRSPHINIVLSSTSVQGDRAPEEIVAALDRLCRTGGVDVIIIGRGGGSIEDLWAFNDERVVRAVAACPFPIVSAVGHETDFTLTDFAADLRASTPSAAAEMVVPDRRELQDGILHVVARLRNSMANGLNKCIRAANEMLNRLSDPRRKIEDRRQRSDDLTTRLVNLTRRRFAVLLQETQATVRRLRPEHLVNRISRSKTDTQDAFGRLIRSAQGTLRDSRRSVEELASRLESLSPLAVLARGYSVTVQPETGTVVRDAAFVQTGDQVRVMLHRGSLDCVVKGKTDQ